MVLLHLYVAAFLPSRSLQHLGIAVNLHQFIHVSINKAFDTVIPESWTHLNSHVRVQVLRRTVRKCLSILEDEPGTSAYEFSVRCPSLTVVNRGFSRQGLSRNTQRKNI